MRHQALTVRLARAHDAAALAQMSRELIEYGLPWSWTPDRVRRSILDPESNVVIACSRDNIAGFAAMTYGDTRSHLNLLAVRRTFWRGGVGRQLVRWLETTAIAAGTPLVRLEVRADNPGARAFYLALGYTPVLTIPGYYSRRIAAVRMQHDLRKPSG